MRKESSWSQTSPLKHSVLGDCEMPTKFSKTENKTPILCNQPNCFSKSPNIGKKQQNIQEVNIFLKEIRITK